MHQTLKPHTKNGDSTVAPKNGHTHARRGRPPKESAEDQLERQLAGLNGDDEFPIEDEGDLDLESANEGTKDFSPDGDPVRTYLIQMGNIDLIDKKKEVELSKQIQKARAKFTLAVFSCCDHAMNQAISLLSKVKEGAFRLDRAIEVSVTDKVAKRKILSTLPVNLATVIGIQRDVHTKALSVLSKDWRERIKGRIPEDALELEPDQQRKAIWKEVCRR